MAELVDALDSKSSSARSAGSIPARGTTLRPSGYARRGRGLRDSAVSPVADGTARAPSLVIQLSNSHLPLLQACVRSLAAGWARAMRWSRASKHERRREGRTSTEARGPPAQKNAGGRYHRSSRTTRPSLRDSLRCPSCSPWGPGFLAPITRAHARTSAAGLTSASGGRDHTTSPSAMPTLVWRGIHVHRSPPPRFVTTPTPSA